MIQSCAFADTPHHDARAAVSAVSIADLTRDGMKHGLIFVAAAQTGKLTVSGLHAACMRDMPIFEMLYDHCFGKGDFGGQQVPSREMVLKFGRKRPGNA
ncbi:hypothetical protein [Peribacillus simplex]|uniref:hypothetical protein n=1 Tax=Peribacillus simplex TaxID=1478 RepID=UPI0021A8AF7B|nr:hypothetical protein [Peribacillus simplex]